MNPYETPHAAVADAASAIDTLNVARTHRSYLLCWLVMILGNIGSQALSSSSGGAAFLTIPLTLAVFGAWIACIVLTWRLMKATGAESTSAILVTLVAFVPCVNLLAAVYVNSRAMAHLRSKGVRVGLIGPSPESIAELEAKARA